MADLGTAATLPLLDLGLAANYLEAVSAMPLGTATTLPLLSLPGPVTAYGLAGTFTPEPCPDCPELPDGILWPPGGRYARSS